MTTPSPVAWYRRLDTRVAVALGSLVAVALAVMWGVTAEVASTQSRARAVVDLDVAHHAFRALLDGRIAAAERTAEVITQLPVFRAHLAETRLVSDRPSMDAMAEAHRVQMDADFVLVAAADGAWLGSAGWDDAPRDGTPALRAVQATALAGRNSGAVIRDGARLFLVVAVPARFADEIVGAFVAGFALTDSFATDLARLARCDVALVAGGHLAATSLASGRDEGVPARLIEAAARPGVHDGMMVLGPQRYVAGVYPLRPGGNS